MSLAQLVTVSVSSTSRVAKVTVPELSRTRSLSVREAERTSIPLIDGLPAALRVEVGGDGDGALGGHGQESRTVAGVPAAIRAIIKSAIARSRTCPACWAERRARIKASAGSPRIQRQ